MEQPRSQGLSSYRSLGRARRDPGTSDEISSLAPGGGKMRDPGNEVEMEYVSLANLLLSVFQIK